MARLEAQLEGSRVKSGRKVENPGFRSIQDSSQDLGSGPNQGQGGLYQVYPECYSLWSY